MSTQLIHISDIRSEDRMRTDVGSLDSLCEAMHEKGLLQGIGVQRQDGKFRLLWGHRRLQAALRLGWENIEAKIAYGLEDYEASEVEFMENWERKSMTWQEEAIGLLQIHTQRVRKGALIGERWGQRETGRLLGIAMGNVNYTLKVARLLQSGDLEVAHCHNMAEALRLLLRRKDAEVSGSGKAPSETFFKKEDMDRFNDPQGPSAPSPEVEYHLHRVLDAKNFNVTGSGIIGLADTQYTKSAWILDRNDECYSDLFNKFDYLQGGIVFRDLSAHEGRPFIQGSLVHFQFYYVSDANFAGANVPPYFADGTTLERILHGPSALAEGFWRWFFLEVVRGSFSCVYFNMPRSVEALTFCLRHNHIVYATISDDLISKVEKEMCKYGSFKLVNTGV